MLNIIHTHTHPFNSPLSGTTQVSRYQKKPHPLTLMRKKKDLHRQKNFNSVKIKENVTGCIKYQKTTDLAASEWVVTPGVGLASFTSNSLSKRWTNTLASDWVTDMPWQ